MKVRIEFTVEVDDEYREAINNQYGRPGKANREEVRDWFTAYGSDEGMMRLTDELSFRRDDL